MNLESMCLTSMDGKEHHTAIWIIQALRAQNFVVSRLR
jgi:hypothetical protein